MDHIEKHIWKRIRRLHVEGYGLAWIKKYTTRDERVIERALQLPYDVHGPVQKLTFY